MEDDENSISENEVMGVHSNGNKVEITTDELAELNEFLAERRKKQYIKEAFMKKILIILAMIMTLTLTACGGGGVKEEGMKEANTVAQTDKKEIKKEIKKVEESKEFGVGDKVEIEGAEITLNSTRLIKDFEGNDAIAFNFTWTNNSEETADFGTTIMHQIFQDGTELVMAITDGTIDVDNYNKSIRPGITLENVEVAYTNDSTNDIELELSKWLGNKKPTLVNVPFPIE